MDTRQREDRNFWLGPVGIAAGLFLVAAAYFIWTEHAATPVIAVIPYVFALLCGAMYVFAHAGYRGGSGHGTA